MVELLLLRMDHFRDRSSYISELRKWLEELQIAHGRLISMGKLLLLFVAGSANQNERLLQFYKERHIDTNARGERCVDKFIDVLGRKSVESCSCRGFLEMDVLSGELLQKVLVTQWDAEQQWLDTALKTERTRPFLEWREAAKAARKQKRQKEGQEKQKERELKKQKREQEAAQKKLEEEAVVKEEAEVKEEIEVKEEATAGQATVKTTPSLQKAQQNQATQERVKAKPQKSHQEQKPKQKAEQAQPTKTKKKRAKRRNNKQ